MKFKNLFYALVLLAVLTSCKKEEEKTVPSWSKLTTADGLLDNEVQCVIQASDNTIWVGSSKGVSRFKDGVWTKFPIGGDENIVNDIIQDAEGHILAATNREGVKIFDGNAFIPYDDEFLDDCIKKLYLNSDGWLWVIDYYEGATGIKGNQYITISNDDYQNSMVSVAEDKDGNMWFGCYDMLIKYDGDSVMLMEIDDVVKGMVMDDSGNIWMACYSSIKKFDGNIFTDVTYGDDYYINAHRTSDGDFWFGSMYDGLFRHHQGQWKNYNDHELVNNYVNDVTEIGNDIWIAVEDVGIVRYHNYKSEEF